MDGRADHPVIDPHYLEEKADVRALLVSLKLSREVGLRVADASIMPAVTSC